MADKCPATAVIAAIRASEGVLRRRPDGKGAGVGWRAVGSIARVARTDDAGAQQTADRGLMIEGPLARDPNRLTRQSESLSFVRNQYSWPNGLHDMAHAWTRRSTTRWSTARRGTATLSCRAT